MNTATHRTIKPLPAQAMAAWQTVRKVVNTPRATLEALEVRESTFDAWLPAGGDRRNRARS